MSIEAAIKAIKRATEISISLSDPKWCELLSITFPDDRGEVAKVFHISATAALANESGELVRVYLNFENPICASPIRDTIRMALRPFIISGRKLSVHETTEGFKIFQPNDRKIDIIEVAHDVRS